MILGFRAAHLCPPIGWPLDLQATSYFIAYLSGFHLTMWVGIRVMSELFLSGVSELCH